MSILGIPRMPPRLVERPRLVKRFEADAAIVVAYAPAGYGKSTALAQWASRTTRHGIWLSVGAEKRDAAGLLVELAAALRDFGIVDQRNPLWDAEAALAAGRSPWAVARGGLRGIGSDLTVVLDGADRLAAPLVDGLVRLVVDDPRLSLRIATRTRSFLTSAALRAVVDVDVVGADELALTDDEAMEILDDEAAVEAVRAQGGAPAFASLILVTADSGHGPAEFTAATAEFLRTLLESRDGGFSDFVHRTCFADAMDEALAERLAPGADVRVMLERAEEEGLGAWTEREGDHPGPLFAYAPFLRDAARQLARERLPAVEIADAHAAVSCWELDRGRSLVALRRAIDAGAWESALEIATGNWPDFVMAGPELRDILLRVPTLVLRQHPLFAFLLAILFDDHDRPRTRALQYFTIAQSGARRLRAGAPPPLRALFALIESVCLRMASDYERAMIAARIGLDTLAAIPPWETGLGPNASLAHHQFGIVLFYGGDLTGALESFERADASVLPISAVARRDIAAAKATTLVTAGHVVDAAQVIAEAGDAPWPDAHGVLGYRGTLMHVADAFIRLEDGDPAGALEALRLPGDAPAFHEHWAVMAAVRGLALVLSGRPDEAAVEMSTAIRRGAQRQAYPEATAIRLLQVRVSIELARGDIGAAEHLVGAYGPVDALRMPRARIAVAKGDPEAAMRALGQRLHETDADALDASARVRAQLQSLRIAARAMAGGDPRDLAVAFHRLDAHLADRGLFLPLALVPAVGLDAIEEVVGPELRASARERLDRSRETNPFRGLRAAPRLTPRERAVARELVRHDTIGDIARSLTVSPNTVKSQVRSLYRKLGVSSRLAARQVLAAFDLGDA